MFLGTSRRLRLGSSIVRFLGGIFLRVEGIWILGATGVLRSLRSTLRKDHQVRTVGGMSCRSRLRRSVICMMLLVRVRGVR
jgi:hypothetical protein